MDETELELAKGNCDSDDETDVDKDEVSEETLDIFVAELSPKEKDSTDDKAEGHVSRNDDESFDLDDDDNNADDDDDDADVDDDNAHIAERMIDDEKDGKDKLEDHPDEETDDDS